MLEIVDHATYDASEEVRRASAKERTCFSGVLDELFSTGRRFTSTSDI